MDRKQAAFALSGIAVTLLLSAGRADAKTVELRNDTLADNAEANAVCGFAVGEKFAARFLPPAYPATIKKVQVLLTNVGLDPQQCSKVAVTNDIVMPIEIFNAIDLMPGVSKVVLDNYTFSNETVLNEIDISSKGVTIDSGSFVVAFTLDDDRASPLVDKSTPAVGANYIYGDIGSGASWYAFEALGASAPKGNWVVRLVVDVPGEDDAGAGDGGETPDAGTADAAEDGSAGSAGSAGAAGASASDAGIDGAAGETPAQVEASGGGCAMCTRAPLHGLMLLAGAAAFVFARRRRTRTSSA